MKPTRRALMLGTSAAILASSARAQTLPKQIRIVVPYPPGGGADTTARFIQNPLQEALGSTIVVENKPGAAGMIGDEVVAKATPDGGTLLLGAFAHAVNPLIQPKMPFKTPDDFAPVSLLTSVPELLVITPSHPAKTVADLVALAKAKPGTLFYASSGAGSAQHLAAELFKLRTGTDIGHVPYKGGGLAVGDVAAGHIPFYFGNMSAALPQARAGHVRALAVTSAQRSPAAPDVPTMAEAGVKDCVISEWNGILAPAATPKPLVDKISEALARIMRDPAIKAKFNDLGADTFGSTPAELGAYMEAERKKWAEVVKAAHIKIE
ncbi:MAG: tripartite tricarboxylate transporter substrate binding protein [Proteobacteria bacterium]|nr:tripartite tricarboxylate transporter substrate binding protein [Pseudomonadota bacterium]